MSTPTTVTQAGVEAPAGKPLPPARPRVADPSRKRNADIELLRTIAIGFVLVQHANLTLVFNSRPLLWMLSWGQLWPGVDLFFVISGYLMTTRLLSETDAVQQDAWWRGHWAIAWRFWVRRAWRLWPVAWLWLVLIVIGSAVWRQPPFLGPLGVNVRHALAGVFFYANYALATNGWTPYGASLPYWSLSLEEQFYFALPLCFALGRPFVLVGALATIVLQFPQPHGVVYFFFRSDALLWGIALAFFRRSQAYERASYFLLSRHLAAWMLLVLCLGAMFRVAGVGNTTPPFVAGTIAVCAVVLVWMASYDRDYLCPGALRPTALWVGPRSYALYVAHMPIYLCGAALAHTYFAPRESLFSGTSNGFACVIAAPLLLLSVEVTHRFVEQPLRQHFNGWSKRKFSHY